MNPLTLTQLVFPIGRGSFAHVHVSSLSKALLASASLMAWTGTSVNAQITYAQDFNAAGATATSVGWNGGFAYAGGDSETQTLTSTGIAGSGALVTTLNITDGPNLGAFTEFYSGTITLPPGANAFNLSLTADITGNQTGAPFQFTINDHEGHYINFISTVASAGAFQSVGGLLSSANAIDPAFDYAGTAGYSFQLDFYGANGSWSNGSGSLTIDNVVLETVPPSGTNYFQNFNAPGATAASVGWNGGFAYSGGDSETQVLNPTAGVGGTGGLVTTVNITDPTSLGAFTQFYSGTIALPPEASIANLSLTADFTGNQTGVPFSFKINDNAGHYIVFNNNTVGSAGTFQSVGGLLSSANGIDPDFDFASTAGYSIFLSLDSGGTTPWAIGTGSLTIDNVVLQTIAPPSSLAPFPLTIARQAGGALALAWPSVAGHSYAVQVSGALSGTQWFNLASPITATSTNLSYTNNLVTGAAQFYRIQSE